MKTQFDQYVQSWVGEPYRVLGVPLREFSLGHYILLQRFGCLGTNDVLHFFLSVAICARTFDDFIVFIHAPEEFQRWFRHWGKLLKKEKNLDFIYHMLLFTQYMNEGLQVPLFFHTDKEEQTMPTGVHWAQNIISALTQESSRYSEKELLDLPLSKVLADYFKLAEDRGFVQLMTDDEIEQIKEKETTHGPAC